VSRGRLALLYALLLVGTAALFAVIQAAGAGLQAPPAPAPAAAAAGPRTGGAALPQVLTALLAILVASRALGALCRRLQQPPVMGEVLAGLLLGPSLLGRAAPEAFGALFPPAVLPALELLAQLGVILFMFLVGLELNESLLREETHTTVAIAHASIAAPFVLGAALALWLYPQLSHAGVSFTAFALFLGASMAVTAFPVLARILQDRGLHGTPLGAMALTCAAVDDATAWCLLAFVVGVVQAQLTAAAGTLLLTAAYVAAMFALVRPLARRWAAGVPGDAAGSAGVLAAGLAAVLFSSLVTEGIGIHALFGAFLVGAVIPHDSAVARALRDRLEGPVLVLLLPAFFAVTGLRTEVGLITGGQWLLCLAVVAVACVGKVGGTALAARFCGVPGREAACLGVLMNTRGLMGLIVLNLGLDLGVISPTLFAMLVVTAIVTTLATAPLLDLLAHPPAPEASAATPDARAAAR